MNIKDILALTIHQFNSRMSFLDKMFSNKKEDNSELANKMRNKSFQKALGVK